MLLICTKHIYTKWTLWQEIWNMDNSNLLYYCKVQMHTWRLITRLRLTDFALSSHKHINR